MSAPRTGVRGARNGPAIRSPAIRSRPDKRNAVDDPTAVGRPE
ncbi:hypothetical protein [Skermania piniformis]|nr:hypothetical protein [Skermania piniformis]